jgi:hypothetical protein
LTPRTIEHVAQAAIHAQRFAELSTAQQRASAHVPGPPTSGPQQRRLERTHRSTSSRPASSKSAVSSAERTAVLIASRPAMIPRQILVVGQEGAAVVGEHRSDIGRRRA